MRLETKRLILREYEERDWYAVLAYQSDPRYLEPSQWHERKPADVRAFVQQFTGWQRETPRYRYQLAVTLRESDRLVGSCGLRKPTPKAQQAELGYEIAPDFWGQGLATEAARAMVQWGSDELGLHRIYAQCLAENTASARVMLKLGMVQEGKLRDDRLIKGVWRDTLIHGLLAAEWRPV